MGHTRLTMRPPGGKLTLELGILDLVEWRRGGRTRAISSVVCIPDGGREREVVVKLQASRHQNIVSLVAADDESAPSLAADQRPICQCPTRRLLLIN